ncbi:MAG: hypothetical protein ACPL0C_06995 [Candidatus Bathyarchaeales archaeon]
MKWYWMLLTIVFVILGISTLLPTSASKPSMLGYYAHCTFAPVSTIICWTVAAIFYWISRKRTA